MRRAQQSLGSLGGELWSALGPLELSQVGPGLHPPTVSVADAGCPVSPWRRQVSVAEQTMQAWTAGRVRL